MLCSAYSPGMARFAPVRNVAGIALFRNWNTTKGQRMTDTIIDKDIRERLRLMRELLGKAESTLGEDFGSAIADPVARRGNAAAIRADYLAKLQRVSGWALRDAVTDGLQHGMTWRWMGTASQLPVGTLHRQYNAGGRIVVHDDVTQEPDYSAPQPLSESEDARSQ
ncbi:hypothetical protein BTO20_37900 (plasmid) [Mycobacterium dioxanotrophicus]|uniref:Uncharacterized protein n=2 Tax=Mycobacterium dioxanotrophicus TaxID=482462 RepID=A0A1Y0CHJ7_9MYCO|nr:hypothetical protein BTO20_37900 [Mycobacterium dioxanotrophicus]